MMTMITQLFQALRPGCFADGPLQTSTVPPVERLTLARAPIGQPVRLVAVRGDRKMVHRMAELGLTPGVTLRVVQTTGGPFLVAVRGARIAIGRELAQQMAVELQRTEEQL